MPSLERSALLPFSADDVYRLVGDIASYPAFVPGCVSANIDALANPGADRLKARLGFRAKGLADTFVTENRMEPGRRIDMRLIEGPFRSLGGSWEFQPLAEQACKVTLRINLEFGNRMLELTLTPWIERATAGVMDAFLKRARVLYGSA